MFLISISNPCSCIHCEVPTPVMLKRRQYYHRSCCEAAGKDHEVSQFVVTHVLDGFYLENLFRGISFFLFLIV